jgi:hypothetical protein
MVKEISLECNLERSLVDQFKSSVKSFCKLNKIQYKISVSKKAFVKNKVKIYLIGEYNTVSQAEIILNHIITNMVPKC